MGLNTGSKGNRTFVSIVSGQFAKRVEEGTEGAVKRTVITDKKAGTKKDVWEISYRDVNGMIDSIVVKEGGKYGDSLEINMSDIGDHFTVTLGMDSREAKSFLCCLQNINLKAEVILAPFNFKSATDGKQAIGMNTLQGGRTKEFKVKPYFSKDTPNGLPQVPPIKDGEEKDVDEFKIVMKQQEIFLKKWAKKFIAENFNKPVSAVADQDVKANEEPFEPNDQLPF